MTQVNVGLLGFGNVGRAFVRYVGSSGATSQSSIKIRAVADSSGGLLLGDHSIQSVMVYKESGSSLLDFAAAEVIRDPGEFISALRAAGISVLVESLPTNIGNGQPALGLIIAALEQGTDVV